MGGPVMPTQTASPAMAQQMPPQQSAPQQIDFTPVLQVVSGIGDAVMSSVGRTQGEQVELLKALQATLAEVKNLLLVQVTALHHLYITTPSLAQSIQQAGKDVGDANKFVAYMQPFLPR
jgi:hypothetical protein